MKTIELNMKHPVHLQASEAVFKGLAKQNLQFHQCICELIDNSISAKRDDRKFRIDIIFEKRTDQKIWVYVVDNSKGMSFPNLTKAIQIGSDPKLFNTRLNEHGFGLKNALATLTNGGAGDWEVYTLDRKNDIVASVFSPYISPLQVEDSANFPKLPYKIEDVGTLVKAEIKIKYLQGVQERGKPTTDLGKLRVWLMEHLGVIYRAYLLPDKQNKYAIDGEIYVSIGSDVAQVEPIEIPLGVTHKKNFNFEIGGNMYNIIYNWGAIDEEKAKGILVNDESNLKSYYTMGLSTQGIDIRIGKRVIASKVFESVWETKPHADFNEFAGELIIPDTVPRGHLKTVTTKSDFKNDDSDWQRLFEHIRDNFKLPREGKRTTEEDYKKALMASIKVFMKEGDIVTREKSVWPTGTKIDLYNYKIDTKETIIYEVKIDSANAYHIYQLKMYWEGLVEKGENPTEGILVCLEYKSPVEEMVKILNKMKPKDGLSNFNFKLKTLKEMRLMD